MGCHLRHHAIIAGARCIKREVVLSRLCRTRLFLRAGMLKVIGPAQRPKTTCIKKRYDLKTAQANPSGISGIIEAAKGKIHYD